MNGGQIRILVLALVLTAAATAASVAVFAGGPDASGAQVRQQVVPVGIDDTRPEGPSDPPGTVGVAATPQTGLLPGQDDTRPQPPSDP
ncbi:MAG TPA: hypothetical protein VIM22_08635 [Solirubrobacteraceae bacterium]